MGNFPCYPSLILKIFNARSIGGLRLKGFSPIEVVVLLIARKFIDGGVYLEYITLGGNSTDCSNQDRAGRKIAVPGGQDNARRNRTTLGGTGRHRAEQDGAGGTGSH